MQTPMQGMDGDKPSHLRPTRLSGNRNKCVRRLIKILLIKLFNYTWSHATDKQGDNEIQYVLTR